jgi:hypothetical protein
VVLTNGLWLVLYARDALEASETWLNPRRWGEQQLEQSLSIVVLAIGILCEINRRPLARAINIGYYVVLGSLIAGFALAEAAGLINDHGMRVLLFVQQGLPYLVIAAVNLRLYRTTNA